MIAAATALDSRYDCARQAALEACSGAQLNAKKDNKILRAHDPTQLPSELMSQNPTNHKGDYDRVFFSFFSFLSCFYSQYS